MLQICSILNLTLQKYLKIQHGRIHAWIGATIMDYFDYILDEGKVYEIKNLVVKYYESTDRNRCFKEDKYIILSNLTEVVLLNDSHSNIPFKLWKFMDMESITQVERDINHFIGNEKKIILRLKFDLYIYI